MDIVHTLVLGSYVYATALGSFLFRRLEKIRGNELAHVEARLKALEDRQTTVG